ALARGRRENCAEARRERSAEAMIAREPQVLIAIASVRKLLVIRGAEVELVIEQQPAGRPGAAFGFPAQSAERIAELRFAETFLDRLEQIERAAPNGAKPFERQAVRSTERRSSGGDPARGEPIFVARRQRRRRHADDAARARAVLDRKAT